MTETPQLPTDTPAASNEKFRQLLAIAKPIALMSFVGLLMLFTVKPLLSSQGSIKIWLIQCLPFFIFIPGLLKNRYRTYSWICFVTLAYFTFYVPLVMGRGSWSDWAAITLLVTLFISAMMTSRWLQRV